MGNGPLAEALPDILAQSGAPAAAGAAPAAGGGLLGLIDRAYQQTGGSLPAGGMFGAGAAKAPPGEMSGKDQSRLNDIGQAGAVPERSPFRIDQPAGNPDAPIPVKTQTIDPRTNSMFAPAGAGNVETVQGVPMEGGVMQADPNNKPVLPSATREATPAQDVLQGVMDAKKSLPTTLPGVPSANELRSSPVAPPAGGMFDTTPPRSPGAPPPVQEAPTTSGANELRSSPSMWDALKSGINTAQGKLKGIPTNPMAQAGLALASAGYDGSNPYANIQKALGGMPGTEHTMATTEQLRHLTDQQLREFLAAQASAQGRSNQMQGGSRSTEGQAKVIR